MDVEIYQGEEPPIFRSKVTKKNSNDDKDPVFLVSPNKLPNKQTSSNKMITKMLGEQNQKSATL